MNEMLLPVKGGHVDGAVNAEAERPDATGATEGTISANVAGPVEYPLHPVTADYDDFTKEEFDALCRSLREHGRLLVPIVTWRGETVDGKHRTKACKKEGVPLRYDDITERCPTEEQMRAYVRALNEHRRANTKPLKTAEKRVLIEAALKANPERPNLPIAKEIGVDDKTVASVRQEMEGRSEIPNVDKRSDRRGRKQPARKKSSSRKKLQAPPGQVQDDEPTLFDPPPSLAPDAPPAEKRDAAPPKAAKAPQPPDPTRDYLAHILGAAAALSRVPHDADFDAMAIIIDPSQRERCKKEMDMAAKIARRLLIALERCDLDRGDPPTLPPAAAA
jgi:hypothetical protein